MPAMIADSISCGKAISQNRDHACTKATSLRLQMNPPALIRSQEKAAAGILRLQQGALKHDGPYGRGIGHGPLPQARPWRESQGKPIAALIGHRVTSVQPDHVPKRRTE